MGLAWRECTEYCVLCLFVQVELFANSSRTHARRHATPSHAPLFTPLIRHPSQRGDSHAGSGEIGAVLDDGGLDEIAFEDGAVCGLGVSTCSTSSLPFLPPSAGEDAAISLLIAYTSARF